jgi:Flp pilus assembly protein TadD
VRQLLIAAALTTAFGVVLLGTPSCATTRGASVGPFRRVDRLLADGRFREALPLALENRQQHPDDRGVAWQMARAYQGLGTARDEAAAWEAYLRLAPATGDVCLRLSEVYHSLAQPAQVVAVVNRCLALDDRQPELLGDLAAAYIDLRDPPSAILALKRALALDPAHPHFRAQLRALELAAP